jgi:hypothetical protein
MRIAGLLIFIRWLTRHTPAAIGVGIIVLGYASYDFMRDGGTTPWLAAAFAVGFGAALVLVFTRVGLLAGTVAMFVLLPHRLAGFELDAWFTPYRAADLAIVLALAAYGFWVALAGQPIFKDMLAEPQPAAR